MKKFYSKIARLCCLLAVFLFISSDMMAQPANDDCDGATVTTLVTDGTVYTVSGDNTGATDGEGLGQTYVYEAFTIDTCANVSLSFCNSENPPTEVIQYVIGCTVSIFEFGTTNTFCTSGETTVSWGALPAGTYYYPVTADPAFDADGLYTIELSAAACLPPPPNDNCDGTVTVTALVADSTVYTVSGDNTGATDGYGLGLTYVYEAFTIDECATVYVSYCSSENIPSEVLTLASDCPATFVFGAIDTTLCTSGDITVVFSDLPAGTYYHFVVADPFVGADGEYTIEFSAVACPPAPPANDDCDGATVTTLVTDGTVYTVSGDNTGATDGEGLGQTYVYEAFTIDTCANVSLSFCNSENPPTEVIQYVIGCTVSIFEFGTTNTFCTSGETTVSWGALPAGTYYYPVTADPAFDADGLYTIELSAAACLPPPPNDNCDGTVTVTALVADSTVYTVSGDNTGATDGYGLGLTYVYEAFTIDECATVYVSYCSSENIPSEVLTLASDCPATFVFGAIDTTLCTSGDITVVFSDLPAGTYYHFVVADPFVGADGEYTIEFSAVACPPAPPANDECDGATVTTLVADGTVYTVSGDNTGATDGIGIGTTQVWEAFTIDTCATVSLSFCNSENPPSIVYLTSSDCPSTVGYVGQPDQLLCPTNEFTIVWYILQPGTYYYPVMADTSANAAGLYTIELTALACPLPPANDAACDAIDIVVDAAAITANNMLATPDGPLGSCWTDISNEGDIWFTFTAPASGAVEVETYKTLGLGNMTDSQVAVYSSSDGTCTGVLTEVGCNDDISPMDFMSLAEVSDLTPGDVYWINVDGWGNVIGAFDISVTDSDPLSVIEYTENAYTVYPNPTEDMLNISGENQIDAVVIRDIHGAVVRQLDASSNNVTIDVADLTSGFYIVEVKSGDLMNVSRVIKH